MSSARCSSPRVRVRTKRKTDGRWRWYSTSVLRSSRVSGRVARTGCGWGRPSVRRSGITGARAGPGWLGVLVMTCGLRGVGGVSGGHELAARGGEGQRGGAGAAAQRLADGDRVEAVDGAADRDGRDDLAARVEQRSGDAGHRRVRLAAVV